MTNEEMVANIQAGNEELMPALWEGVRHFVAAEAYKAARLADMINEKSGLDTYNDFYNTGYLAVHEAAHKFDASRGVLFLTCLEYYLKKHFNALRIELSGWSRSSYRNVQNDKKLEKVPHKALPIDSLNRPILGGNSDDAIELGDTIADPEDQYEAIADKSFINSLHNRLAALLDRLPPEQSQAIQLRYYGGLTYEAIARKIDRSPMRAHQLIKTGMDQLRRYAAMGELDDYIERHTNYYARVGVDAFQSTHTSAVELICFKRDDMRRALFEKLNNRKVDADDAETNAKEFD